MNGLELARRLRSRDPDLAIVLATGYSASAKEAIDDGFSVLSKPYNIARLNAVLDAALERASSERRHGAAPAAT
jgi:two-component system NtrC family sensor kinase